MYFFFNDTATPEIYTYRHTLSLHAALPIFGATAQEAAGRRAVRSCPQTPAAVPARTDRRRDVADGCCDPRHIAPAGSSLPAPGHRLAGAGRSEEHTSELQFLMSIPHAFLYLKNNSDSIL